MCAKAQNWSLVSEVLEPLGMLPKSTVKYDLLSATVSAWITQHMNSVSGERLAKASDVLRLIDTNYDRTLLADHIRSRVERSDFMCPEQLLLLQDVYSPVYLITRFTDTFRKLHEQKDWSEVEKLFKLLVRLPDMMRHPDMINLVQETSCAFGQFLDSTNVDQAVTNLAICEHIIVEELESTALVSIVNCVKKRMDLTSSLDSRNHRALQNLPSKSELTTVDFEAICEFLQEQLRNSVEEIRNCYDLQAKLDTLFLLPPYLNILDDGWIYDLSFTQNLRQLPDRSRAMIVLSYYMPITACEDIKQRKQTISLHRQHLIRCIRHRRYHDATTASELILARLSNVDIVKEYF